MAFNAAVAFDPVWGDSALNQIFGVLFFCLFLKDPDENLSYDLSLRLRVCHSFECFKESLLCIDNDKVHAKVMTKRLYYLFLLPLSHEAVVYKDSDKMPANGIVDKCGGNRAI